jgi:hypothetical protein
MGEPSAPEVPPEVIDARVQYLQKELDFQFRQLNIAKLEKREAEEKMVRACKTEKAILFHQHQTYKELRELGVHEPVRQSE